MNKIIKKHKVMNKIPQAESFEVIQLQSENPEFDQKYAVKRPRKMQMMSSDRGSLVSDTLDQAKIEALLWGYADASYRAEMIRQELEELGITDDEVYKYC